MKTKSKTPKMGCGNGQSCSIGLYVTPQGTLKELFEEYATKKIKEKERDLKIE